jgi:Ca2+-binding EF-hand superfamily protein
VKLTFELVDRNNDGFITRDEASRYPSLAENFSLLDRNRSNSLDRSEFVSFAR